MTGVIYVVIIALWAAVLIPIWLKRHDQISEVRSTARFSSAMRTLGGRGNLTPAAAGGPDLAADDPSMHRGGGSSSHMRSEYRMDDRYPYTPSGRDVREIDGLDREYERELVRRSAAMRRTVILGSLTLVLFGSLVLAVLGALPRWVPIMAAIPVVAFVLATAMTASARSAPAARRSAPAARRDVVREEPAVQADDDWESWSAWDDDDAWEAVPTTLPTYVNAPRASAVPREIDRAHPGEWTGQAMVDTARAMRTRAQVAPAAEDVDHAADTAEIPVVAYDERRAANS